MNIPILAPEHRWACPNCHYKSVTHEAEPHSRYHNCKGMKGLSTPMVPAGVKAKVTAVERGDYIGKEQVQYDGDKRPIMNVITEREEGQDCTVYAPAATAGGQAGN